jgi:hypothetical protein
LNLFLSCCEATIFVMRKSLEMDRSWWVGQGKEIEFELPDILKQKRTRTTLTLLSFMATLTNTFLSVVSQSDPQSAMPSAVSSVEAPLPPNLKPINTKLLSTIILNPVKRWIPLSTDPMSTCRETIPQVPVRMISRASQIVCRRTEGT